MTFLWVLMLMIFHVCASLGHPRGHGSHQAACRGEVLCVALTRAADRTHLWGLGDGPAAPGVAAALHLGVLAGEVPGAAPADQSGETRPDPLVCGEGEKEMHP